MTCIVGLVHDGKVYIGGDSAGVSVGRLGLTVRADRKVFRNGEFVMGFTSSFRMGQLLAHSLKPPKRHPEDEVYGWMVTEFINAVRKCLKDGGYAEVHDGAERAGTFLVGCAGRLFQIDGDYQVGEGIAPYAACGCGEQIALGAMHATEGQKMSPKDRVTAALTAAEAFSAGVRAPFHVEATEEREG